MTVRDCTLCDQTFENSSKLDCHFKKVHLNVFSCTKCSKFSTLIKQRLTRHLRAEHGEIAEYCKIFENGKRQSAGNNASEENLEMASQCIPRQDLQLLEEKYVSTYFKTVFNVSNDGFDDDDDDNGYEELERFECEKCWFNSIEVGDLRQHLIEKHFYENQEIFDTIQIQLSKIRLNKSKSKKAKRQVAFKIPDEGLNKSPNGAGNFRVACGLCSYSTNSLASMENHLGQGFHFFPGSKVFCRNCPYSPSNLEEVADHGRSHHEGYSLFKIKCQQCSFVTGEMSKYLKHYGSAHPNL